MKVALISDQLNIFRRFLPPDSFSSSYAEPNLIGISMEKHIKFKIVVTKSNKFICYKCFQCECLQALAVPPLDCKSNPPSFTFLQGWQLLALAVSLFVPKNNR